MGASEYHSRRATSTERTLQCLRRDNAPNKTHNDWIVPVACYKAIHLVEAVYAKTNKHFVTHEERLGFVKQQPEFTAKDLNGISAYGSFSLLTTLCQHAMNLHNGVVTVPVEELRYLFEDALESDVIQTHLRRIETFANNRGVQVTPETYLN